MKFIKKHKKSLSIIFIILASIGLYLGIGVYKVMGSYKKINVDVNQLKQAQGEKSYEGIVSGLDNLKPDIESIQSDLNYFIVIKYIPYLQGYYSNAQHIQKALVSIDAGADKIVKGLKPIANAFGYGSEKVDGKGKIAAFVHGLPVLTPAVDSSINDFKDAQLEIDKINTDYLPSVTVKGINLKKDFVQYKTGFNNIVAFLPKLDSVAPVLQNALGDPNPQNYLLLSQNDKELRPDGGFITAYGYLAFDKGNLGNIDTNDIYSLDAMETLNLKAPAQLQEYNAATRWYLRDANLSPDLPTNAKQIEDFYKSVPVNQRRAINGIVLIDTQFVSSLLNVIGPVYVNGYNQTVNSDNFAYYSEYYSEKADVHKKDRKQFLNLVISTIKDKVFSLQKDKLVDLIKTLTKDLDEKHILVYGNDPQLENFINQYNWGGVFPQYKNGDFFAMVEANLGGAKADFYIKRLIDQKIVKNSGGILKTVTITFTNNQIYDNWLNGPYRAWLRFYIPNGSSFVSLTGTDGTLRKYEDLGYSVIDDHVRVPVKYSKSDPATKLTVVLKYYLPDSIASDSGYSLYIWKQPGLKDLDVRAGYNGKVQKSLLVKDNIFNF